MATPKHQNRYALAWSLWKEPSCSPENKLVLEREMDNAQNNFTWQEFQDFKETLPGYLDHWNIWKKALIRKLGEVTL